MTTITEITNATKGPAFNNTPNQLERSLGQYSVIWQSMKCGTVRANGKCWDYFQTEEVLEGGFKKLLIVPA